MLSSPDQIINSHITRILVVLAKCHSQQNVTYKANSVALLIQLLANMDVLTKQYSICILTHLSLKDGIKNMIYDAGGIPLLVQCLTSDDEQIQRDAVLIIKDLSAEGSLIKKALRDANAIAKIVQILPISKDDTQRHLLIALIHLSANNQANQKEILDKGGIKQLVELLPVSNTDTQEYIAILLGHLCTNNEENQQAVDHDGGVKQLIQLLPCKNSVIHENILHILMHMSPNANAKAILDEGGIPRLILSLKNYGENHIKCITTSLAYLSRYEESRKAMNNAGAIKKLTHLLPTSNIDTHFNICYTLVRLCSDDAAAYREQMQDINLIKRLIPSLTHSDENIKRHTVHIFTHLARDEELRELIYQAQGIQPLVELLRSTNVYIVRDATIALASFTMHELILNSIQKAHGILLLRQLLTSTDDKTKENAMKILSVFDARMLSETISQRRPNFFQALAQSYDINIEHPSRCLIS